MKLTQEKLKQMIKEELNEMYSGIEMGRSFEKPPKVPNTEKIQAEIAKLEVQLTELEKEQEEITKLIAMLKNLEK